MSRVTYTDAQIETRTKLFMAAVKGLTASSVAQALNLQTPGINWMGCSKGHMADAFAANDLDHHTHRPPWLDLAKLQQDAVEAHKTRRKRGLSPI